jgi:hypothetical protein
MVVLNESIAFAELFTDQRRPKLFAKNRFGDRSAVDDLRQLVPDAGRIEIELIADPIDRTRLVAIRIEPQPGEVPKPRMRVNTRPGVR